MIKRLASLAFIVIVFIACRPSTLAQSVALEQVLSGLDRPVALTHAGDMRLFVVLQSGQVLVVEQGELLAEPFLDISEQVSCCGERGLLGLAFHPDYQSNGQFFVNYTSSAGNTLVERFVVSDDPNRAEIDSEALLLRIVQPYGNHNGGHLAFGPDGYLYIATGDGGSGGDPLNAGQDLLTLLGKLLRIDVDGAEPYAIPESNPFASVDNALPEIWAYGLRNPWRFSFDRDSGDLFIADVGQSRYEEVNFQAADSQGGENYGWRLMEGGHCFVQGCDRNGLVLPILEYDHDRGNSITGGYRYRGEMIDALVGYYVYGDFGSGRIWTAYEDAGEWTAELLLNSDYNISSFGEDSQGELYLLDYAGSIYKFVGP